MKHLFFIFTALLLASCTNGEKETAKKDSVPKIVEDYEKVDGQNYRAFYGGNNQLKTEGFYDEKGKRHGIWTHYTVDGKKQSITEYKNGVKDGYSIVYHPNGSLYYRGEYQNDQMVGVWDFYNTQTGEKSHTKDYGSPKK